MIPGLGFDWTIPEVDFLCVMSFGGEFTSELNNIVLLHYSTSELQLVVCHPEITLEDIMSDPNYDALTSILHLWDDVLIFIRYDPICSAEFSPQTGLS